MALAGRERSYSFVWFLLSGILVVLTLWYVYDEAIGRRTWKKYAAEWTQLESSRLQKAIVEAQKGIDPKELKRLAMEKEKAQQALEGDPYKKAQEELKQKKLELDVANQNLQFAKADL